MEKYKCEYSSFMDFIVGKEYIVQDGVMISELGHEFVFESLVNNPNLRKFVGFYNAPTQFPKHDYDIIILSAESSHELQVLVNYHIKRQFVIDEWSFSNGRNVCVMKKKWM